MTCRTGSSRLSYLCPISSASRATVECLDDPIERRPRVPAAVAHGHLWPIERPPSLHVQHVQIVPQRRAEIDPCVLLRSDSYGTSDATALKDKRLCIFDRNRGSIAPVSVSEVSHREVLLAK